MAANTGGRALLVLATVKQRYYIVARGSGRCQTQVLRIDQHSGKLQFTKTKGQDIFDSENAALEHIQAVDGPIQVLATAPYILGYVVVGPWGLLLVAEKFRVSATLPGNHEVKTVTKTQWHKIPLLINLSMQSVQTPEAGLKDEKAMKDEIDKGIERLLAFPIDGAHFLCDTLDITRPFPSYRAVKEPSWDFVWNRWMSAAFRNLGLDHLCPPLLQGLCESRQLDDFDGAKFWVACISRRGCLHPGPRYKARGLNDYAEPGNELEVEQVLWRQQRQRDSSLLWSRYTWRRGSAPLWWGVSIKNNGIGEAEIKIRQHNTFKGTKRYVRRLQHRYIPNPQLDPDPPTAGPDGDPSRQVPVTFVSLLRKGLPDRDRSEAKLALAFDYVVAQLRKEHGLALTYIALDWHEMDKQLGHVGIVEAFWNTVKDVLPAQGFALGTLEKVGPDHTELCPDRDLAGAARRDDGTGIIASRVSAAGVGWRAHWMKQQRGVTRYNCADSLDRTNVGSFFGAVQVLIEQCRELDIAIARTRPTPDQVSLARGSRDPRVMMRTTAASSISVAPAAAGGPTGGGTTRQTSSYSTSTNPFAGTAGVANPFGGATAGAVFEKLGKQGWEAKIDKNTNRIFYVDHNTRSTTWERPPVPASGRLSSESLSTVFQPGSGPTSHNYLGKSTAEAAAQQVRAGPTGGGVHQRTDSGDADERFEPLTPWCMLRTGKVASISRRVHPEALSMLAELFLVNGDMCAWLYTGSQAMHSERILIFEPENSKLRKAGVGAYGNALVAVKRRYNNVLVDKEKQSMIDVFLGYKQHEYFPSSWLAYRSLDAEGVPLEGDEVADLDAEPVGQIDWPLPERSAAHLMHSVHGHHGTGGGGLASSFMSAASVPSLAALGASGLAAGGGAGGAAGGGLSHVHSSGDLPSTAAAMSGAISGAAAAFTRLSRRGKSMSSEELAEQLKQAHITSQQADEQKRAVRKAGSEAALNSLDSATSGDLINLGAGDSETSSVASAAAPYRPSTQSSNAADASLLMERSNTADLMGPFVGAASVGPSQASPLTGRTGLSPPAAGSPNAGIGEWARFEDFLTPERGPRPGGAPVGLKPALKRSPSPQHQHPPAGTAVDPLASLAVPDLL
ncbi:hypothetical protein GPECTOR_43g858 [Gonium pectorale]|uniref:WW domain-containing protein n=1 Tax=Gonium pectorale TaxID=33097 RepID=A0A150G9A5_GONPE|nr:hypothetical protein GPECTOR_43g858 [Gonium pectorale]|eukprot:KXZ46422.1 hypothetical protein GPECTOR_43g858 [Gonium pectorale]